MVSGDLTKTCPYCAETIKSAAIKCRYCLSDLSPVAVDPASPATAPPAVEARARRETKPPSEPTAEELADRGIEARLVGRPDPRIVVDFITCRVMGQQPALELVARVQNRVQPPHTFRYRLETQWVGPRARSMPKGANVELEGPNHLEWVTATVQLVGNLNIRKVRALEVTVDVIGPPARALERGEITLTEEWLERAHEFWPVPGTALSDWAGTSYILGQGGVEARCMACWYCWRLSTDVTNAIAYSRSKSAKLDRFSLKARRFGLAAEALGATLTPGASGRRIAAGNELARLGPPSSGIDRSSGAVACPKCSSLQIKLYKRLHR